MIKADRLREYLSTESPPESDVQAEPEAAAEPAPVTEPTAVEPDPQIDAEPAQATEPTAAEPEPQIDAESAQVTEHTAVKPDPQIDAEPAPVQEEAAEKSKSPATEIIAEKFSAESSINENLAEQRGKELDPKLIGPPIDSISRNIGINDRFLIIRELLDGDTEKFTNLLAHLEGAGSYQNAVGVLEAQFPGSMEHEGIEILTGLIKRRYT
jgi:hypothetical protein